MMARMTDWRALAHALNRTMSAHAPEWTDRTDSDPGITLLELMAFLAESQLYRGVIDGGASAAARTIHALDAYLDRAPIAVHVNGEPWRRVDRLTDAERTAPIFTFDESTGIIRFGDGVHGKIPERGSTISARYRDGSGASGNTSIAVKTTWPLPHRFYRIALREDRTLKLETSMILSDCWSGKKRPRFFDGRILTADDLQQEQQYHLSKHRHHLRNFHGSGIIEGLQVSIEPGGTTISVQPGLAIDGEGREMCVTEKIALAIPPSAPSPAWIVVEYAERLVDPVPTAAGDAEASRIEEGCNIALASAEPTSGVAVARMVRDENGWRVDTPVR
jgi:hypothetical protein